MKRLGIAILLAGVASVPVFAAKIQTDHNPQVDFSDYKTYGWKVKAPAAEVDPTGDLRKLDELVRRTAGGELEDRGYEAADGEPDFWLSYTAVADPAAYGKRYYGKGWSVGTVEIYASGNLVIEFLDADSGKVIWRGWAQGGIKPEKMDKRVPRIVRQILKKFPPPAVPR